MNDRISYNDQSFTTMKDIDQDNDWRPKTAFNVFQGHRELFTKGQDYIELTYSEWAKATNGAKDFVTYGGIRGKIVLFTEQGAAKLTEAVTTAQDQDRKQERHQRKSPSEQEIDYPRSNSAQMVKLGESQVELITYKGMPVVTLGMIDELHERPEGTARHSFNRHKQELTEGEDYFQIPYEEWRTLNVHLVDDQNDRVSNTRSKGGRRGSMIFLTETGYLMVIKPFTDKRSWEIQRQLVTLYFKAKIAAQGGSFNNIDRTPATNSDEPTNAEILKAVLSLAESVASLAKNVAATGYGRLYSDDEKGLRITQTPDGPQKIAVVDKPDLRTIEDYRHFYDDEDPTYRRRKKIEAQIQEQHPDWLGINNPLYERLRELKVTVAQVWRKKLVGKVSFETMRRAIYEGRTNIRPVHLYQICETLGFRKPEIVKILTKYGYHDFARMITE
ncbi:MAG: ORF6N domain protein [Syntrophorhabdus sp. PtaU1.Bin153]|nr:MAG: ORF6N domain protein [Syntrophorhabdus sp. PtaU1.Bin153]